MGLDTAIFLCLMAVGIAAALWLGRTGVNPSDPVDPGPRPNATWRNQSPPGTWTVITKYYVAKCPACDGWGTRQTKDNPPDTVKCPACEGKGLVKSTEPHPIDKP